VLDCIEQIREVPRCISSANFSHDIRLSDIGVGEPTATISDWRLSQWDALSQGAMLKK
jgi:hypothetical protein